MIVLPPKSLQEMSSDPVVDDVEYLPNEGFLEHGKQIGSIYWVHLVKGYCVPGQEGIHNFSGSTIEALKEQLSEVAVCKCPACMA